MAYLHWHVVDRPLVLCDPGLQTLCQPPHSFLGDKSLLPLAAGHRSGSLLAAAGEGNTPHLEQRSRPLDRLVGVGGHPLKSLIPRRLCPCLG